MARVSPRRGRAWGLVALLLALVVLMAGAQPAVAIPAPIQVAGTGGQGVYLRLTPNTSQPAVGWMPEGASPDFTCFTYGQMIGNVNVWFSVKYNGATGYYASYYDNSSYSSEAELTARYRIPKCVPPSSSITIKDRSARGRALQGFEAVMEKSAAGVEVHGQTLARLIYHEGGNYLSIRREAVRNGERLLPASFSVGVAGIRPSTARSVLKEIYRDPNVDRLTDRDLRNKLIDDLNFSIKVAAGYMRQLQNAGLQGEWPQFMAYSLGVGQAVKWKAAGHPMTRQSLRAMGFTGDNRELDVFIQRQQHFNNARNAIG